MSEYVNELTEKLEFPCERILGLGIVIPYPI